eukprot:TRINITY_DN6448_c0_g1_i1.p1 TRINITY_DN6448_c0_g1~~TRINITY_DN6448_c0_g1_i1.p1  ORF type:complete len:108 (-),score=1.41 TRINITY_DN6448_c0_g1_i1:32-355(-)
MGHVLRSFVHHAFSFSVGAGISFTGIAWLHRYFHVSSTKLISQINVLNQEIMHAHRELTTSETTNLNQINELQGKIQKLQRESVIHAERIKNLEDKFRSKIVGTHKQ